MSRTILQPREVILNSPVRRDYPLGYITQHIKRKELKFFRDCLGIDFYNALIADLKEVETALCYDGNETYATGERVHLDGLAYTSVEDNNNDNPIDSDKWSLDEKFNEDEYNELWDEYLKYYLSYSVIYTSIAYSNIQAGSRGLVQLGADSSGASGVPENGKVQYKIELLNDMNDYLDLMIEFINESESDLFDLSKVKKNGSCYDKNCSQTNRRNRRIMFRENDQGDN